MDPSNNGFFPYNTINPNPFPNRQQPHNSSFGSGQSEANEPPSLARPSQALQHQAGYAGHFQPPAPIYQHFAAGATVNFIYNAAPANSHAQQMLELGTPQSRAYGMEAQHFSASAAVPTNSNINHNMQGWASNVPRFDRVYHQNLPSGFVEPIAADEHRDPGFVEASGNHENASGLPGNARPVTTDPYAMPSFTSSLHEFQHPAQTFTRPGGPHRTFGKPPSSSSVTPPVATVPSANPSFAEPLKDFKPLSAGNQLPSKPRRPYCKPPSSLIVTPTLAMRPYVRPPVTISDNPQRASVQAVPESTRSGQDLQRVASRGLSQRQTPIPTTPKMQPTVITIPSSSSSNSGVDLPREEHGELQSDTVHDFPSKQASSSGLISQAEGNTASANPMRPSVKDKKMPSLPVLTGWTKIPVKNESSTKLDTSLSKPSTGMVKLGSRNRFVIDYSPVPPANPLMSSTAIQLGAIVLSKPSGQATSSTTSVRPQFQKLPVAAEDNVLDLDWVMGVTLGTNKEIVDFESVKSDRDEIMQMLASFVVTLDSAATVVDWTLRRDSYIRSKKGQCMQLLKTLQDYAENITLWDSEVEAFEVLLTDETTWVNSQIKKALMAIFETLMHLVEGLQKSIKDLTSTGTATDWAQISREVSHEIYQSVQSHLEGQIDTHLTNWETGVVAKYRDAAQRLGIDHTCLIAPYMCLPMCTIPDDTQPDAFLRIPQFPEIPSHMNVEPQLAQGGTSSVAHEEQTREVTSTVPPLIYTIGQKHGTIPEPISKRGASTVPLAQPTQSTQGTSRTSSKRKDTRESKVDLIEESYFEKQSTKAAKKT